MIRMYNARRPIYYEQRYAHPGKTLFAFIMGGLTVAAVGGYMLFGSEGRRRRIQAEAWIDDAQDMIRERASKISDLSRSAYDAIVDEVMQSYGETRDMTQAQLRRTAARLKSKYYDISERARESARQAQEEVDEEY